MTEVRELERLARLVQRKLIDANDEVGDLPSSRYHEWRQRRDRADAGLMSFFVSRAGAKFTSRPGGEFTVKMAGIRSSSTGGWSAALRNWQTAAEKRIWAAQDVCSGHVASTADPKVCGRCGIHIDELRPPDDGFNPHGSGPVPIEEREG